MCPICAANRKRLWWTLLSAGCVAIDALAAQSGFGSGADLSHHVLNGGLLATAALGLQPTGTPDTILGQGQYRYKVNMDWGALPPDRSIADVGDVAGLTVDSRDNVYLFTRAAPGKDPILVFNREGQFLRSWGSDLGIKAAHGAAIGPDDALYLTDHTGHAVRKCTVDGKLLLTIGIPGKPAVSYSGDPFERCTHTALSPSGEIYVSDGYGNSRVHKFTPDGKLLFSWGETGTGPGQFDLPHNICTDAEGWVYVADRENQRIQVFSPDGRYETQWNNLARPCGLFMSGGPAPLVYIGELGPLFNSKVRNLGPRVTITTLTGEILAHLGTEAMGEGADQFVAPHAIAADSRGDIYVGEVSNTLWPLVFGSPPKQPLKTIRKLERLPAA